MATTPDTTATTTMPQPYCARRGAVETLRRAQPQAAPSSRQPSSRLYAGPWSISSTDPPPRRASSSTASGVIDTESSWAAPSSVSTAPAAARAPTWRSPAAVIRPITTTAPMRVACGSGSGAVHSTVSSPARKAAASPATTTRARSSPWILIPAPSRPPCAGAPVLGARVPGTRAAGREHGSPPARPGRSVCPMPTHPRSPAPPVRPDAIYAEPRLAACYDTFDGPRDDLYHYQEILAELGARSVIDVGCGTGSLATRLAADGLAVTGVDPARASLDIAR